ncbi:sensor histidine kinase [Amycolatopsis magusensis]|uniref:sensor histidine kinase n=1 Tax=Amycolatopsis magusensis TaxID=882444 RepID=UPI0024A94BE3|nr:histidine kinase [Amycolatopsis magusensis]MDI5975820.1 histidine kinase [Amycolatopsis magusensis]
MLSQFRARSDVGMIVLVGALLWASGLGTGSWQAVLAGAVQLLPLAVRRQAPGVVLAVVGAATVAQLLLGPPRNVAYVPVLLGLYTVAAAPRQAVRWGVAGGVAVAVAVVMGEVKGLVEGTLLALVVFGLAWTLGLERRRHVADRARIARHEVERAAAERRERTARRLHDTLAHTTTVMLVQAEALRTTSELSGADRKRVDAILSAGREALTEVRQTLRDLAEDDEHPGAVTAELPELLERLRAAGLVLPEEPVDLPDGVAGALAGRVIAEAATNALRHAGPGTRVRISTRIRDRESQVEIVSDLHSVAKSAEGSGFGLASLTAELAEHGGRLEAGPRGRRWVVRAVIPVPAVPTP